jgi:putative ABC transport system permease protein
MSVTSGPISAPARRAPSWTALLPDVAQMALGSLRANVMRSLLTMLGVVVGVATVVAMASIIQGFNQQVETSFASFGSNVIYIRKLRPGLFSPDLVDTVKRRPAFTVEDAKALRRLCPDVREVAIIGFQENLTLSYRGRTTRGVQVIGADPAVQEVNAYDPWLGRFFTPEEVRRSAPVLVLGRDIREAVMPGGEPVGKIMHLNRIPFLVVGELEPKGKGLFFNPDEILTIPYTTLDKYFPPPPDASFYIPKRGEYYLNAVAIAPERTAAAVDEISEVLRRRRAVPARGRDNFAVFTEEALTELYNQLTGATYAVMLIISSISLLVGGIGVMNIMLVAVTERTREIGLRKALGAPRVSILFQFLLEAATLTGIGGLIGLVLGAGAAQAVRAVSGLPAHTPWWSAVLGFCFSVGVGLFFGMFPAVRAARLDAVEALRWE